MPNKIVIGIDLAGNENNRSGLAIVKEEFGQKDIKARSIYTDDEIITEIRRLKPNLIAIDAPLTTNHKDRKADKELKKYGALSIGLPGIQMLAKRGMKLSAKIKNMDVNVIEVLPKATEEIMGIQRDSLSKSAHQADAILAALTGFFHLEKNTKEIGDKDGKIVIPKPSRKKPLQQKE